MKHLLAVAAVLIYATLTCAETFVWDGYQWLPAQCGGCCPNGGCCPPWQYGPPPQQRPPQNDDGPLDDNGPLPNYENRPQQPNNPPLPAPPALPTPPLTNPDVPPLTPPQPPAPTIDPNALKDLENHILEELRKPHDEKSLLILNEIKIAIQNQKGCQCKPTDLTQINAKLDALAIAINKKPEQPPAPAPVASGQQEFYYLIRPHLEN